MQEERQTAESQPSRGDVAAQLERVLHDAVRVVEELDHVDADCRGSG